MPEFNDPNRSTDIPAGSNGHPVRSGHSSDSVTVQQGGAQSVQAQYVEMYQSGAGSIKADEVHLQDGGAGLVAADHVDVTASQVGAIVANRVASADTRAAVVIAGTVEGSIQTLLDARTAGLIGGLAAVGLAVAGIVVALVLRRTSAG